MGTPKEQDTGRDQDSIQLSEEEWRKRDWWGGGDGRGEEAVTRSQARVGDR
jgi:hypothetical protein